MPKSLTSKRQDLKKKKKQNKTRKWSGTQESIIFGCVMKYRWIIIIRMRPVSNHLIKMEHNRAYNSNVLAHKLRLCSLVARVSDTPFWIYFFFHSFIEKFVFWVESRLFQVFYNKLLHHLTNGGHDLKRTMTLAGWRIVGYWLCKLSVWASGGYGIDIKNKDRKLSNWD